MKYILALPFLLTLLLTGCASYEITDTGRALRTEDQYFEIVQKNSDRTTRYSGLYNVLEMQATLLSSEVLEAQLDQKTRIYLWDDNKFQTEKNLVAKRLSTETEFFLSFFTPEKKNDDLGTPKTLWKTFLDVEGRRYEGKVIRIKSALAELTSLYPTHNRFYTAYSLIFPVSEKSIEGKEMKITVTGPVGSGTLNFNKK
ncbi:hypothetical protein ACLVWU_03280 [Bdellovibrio sp. HCB290]|uniref:hypothetical protein n=1 Tax=Bdellovibrio sp. HCB290 TaxID=3394356 RepID=UPI0039B3E3A6